MAKAIIREVSEGVNAGEGISKLSSRISKATGVSKNRATVIARTETINAVTDAALLRFEQYGVTEFRYIAASDSRVCKRCSDNNGKVFKTTDLEHRPPIHPQCRCAVAPVIKNNKKAISPTKTDNRAKVVKESIVSSSSKKPDTTGFIDYRSREDFSEKEIKAIEYYQDNGHGQHTYECKIPETEKHKDCYVVNNSLRFIDFKANLSPHDISISEGEVIDPLRSAMLKSSTPRDITVVKGLDDGQWLLDSYTMREEAFSDEGFGSYSLSLDSAKTYATIRKYTSTFNGVEILDEARVFIRIQVKKGHKAIFLEKDSELLLDSGFKGIIKDIVVFNKGELFDDSKAIFYNIKDI